MVLAEWAQGRCETPAADRAQLVSGLTEEGGELELTVPLFGQQSEPSAFSRRGEVQGGHGRRSSRLDPGNLEWIVGLWEQMAQGALLGASLNAVLKP